MDSTQSENKEQQCVLLGHNVWAVMSSNGVASLVEARNCDEAYDKYLAKMRNSEWLDTHILESGLYTITPNPPEDFS